MEAVAEERELLGCHLVADVLRSSRSVTIRVTGSSMLPNVLPGDLLTVERARVSDLDCGDIAVFARENRLFAHRVVEKAAQNYLATRGDSLLTQDRPVQPDELLGRVKSILRGDRSINPRTTVFGRLASAMLRHSEVLTQCLLWLHCRTRPRREGTGCQI